MTRNDILRKAETIMDKQERDRKFYWACKRANICPKCGAGLKVEKDIIKCLKCDYKRVYEC